MQKLDLDDYERSLAIRMSAAIVLVLALIVGAAFVVISAVDSHERAKCAAVSAAGVLAVMIGSECVITYQPKE